MLFDAEFGGELAQVVEVVEEHGVREPHFVRGDAHGVSVEVDHADAALGVGVPQEPGLAAVRHHDEVAQDALPRGVRPYAGDEGGGDGQRPDHPALDVGDALALVAFQPFHELAQAHDHRVVGELRGYGFQPPARRVAAHHGAVLEGDFVVAGLDPTHE